jgi:hypothetical protein
MEQNIIIFIYTESSVNGDLNRRYRKVHINAASLEEKEALKKRLQNRYLWISSSDSNNNKNNKNNNNKMKRKKDLPCSICR